ncbi:group-specific protein [Paenibacillus ihbetae]|uniref:Group-specific protein n=1 Tax=Paenibacillus ihbetae TaxID=1870820 RepID=A0A1B2E952_9BACL|nr:DUF771 domain-containing protein [Paenibacillus ihbetae]ANY76412.1 group-specific protein [Paenibacillus ihbetae]
MVTVQLNETEVLKIYEEKIAEMLKDADKDLVFWDSGELTKRTCMSWSTIQNTFFYDPRFVKRKIGGKWYFPAQETRQFLEMWIREQRAR